MDRIRIHSLWLDWENNFQLKWVTSENEVTFSLTAKATGYVGFGFSPNGGMAGADMVIVWIDKNGVGQISDRHGTKNGYPPKDDNQNWDLLKSGKNATHIWADVSRKKKTCDTQDFDLHEGDTVKAIWSIGDEIPESDTGPIAKHSNRGTRSINLFYKQTKNELKERLSKLDGSQIEVIDIKMENVAVPSQYDTIYWCKFFHFERPETSIIAYDIVLDPVENRPFVHHMVLYGCNDNLVSMDFDNSMSPGVKKNEINPMNYCSEVAAAWAYGGEAFVFPEDIGQPIFGQSGYYMLEMHYDNPKNKKDIVDSSGLQFYSTTEHQKLSAQMGLFGPGIQAWDLIVPPKQKEFTVYSYCTAPCTNNLRDEGHHFLAGFVHTHLAGKRVKMRHVRNGTELKPIFDDRHYDFNYQQMNLLNEPVMVLPGDEFILECVYDTSDREKTTFGGPSTRDEMCLAFLLTYPKIDNSSGFVCVNGPRDEAFLTDFMDIPKKNIIKQRYGGAVKNPDTKKLTPLKDYIDKNVDWQKGQKIDEFQNLWKAGKDGYMYCTFGGPWFGKTSTKVDIKKEYSVTDSCATNSATSTGHSDIIQKFINAVVIIVNKLAEHNIY